MLISRRCVRLLIDSDRAELVTLLACRSAGFMATKWWSRRKSVSMHEYCVVLHLIELTRRLLWCVVCYCTCLLDVEKNRSRHTPQSLAKEILARNGYQSVPPRTPDATKTSVQSAKSTTQPAAQRPPPLPVVIQRESPETITEEQKRLIELRRREALERRNRQRPAVPPPKNPAVRCICVVDI